MHPVLLSYLQSMATNLCLVNMINVREFRESDLFYVRQLHEKYFHNLDFPRFLKYLCSFIIEDEFGDIVLAGGFEQIAEISLVTNQDKSSVVRGRALREVKRIALYLSEKFKVNEVYAFTNDDVLAKYIIRHGFVAAPRAYSIRIQNG